MAKHNKKRNVGLIHEQLVRYASEKLVDGDKDRAEVALDILSSNFQKKTELFREFRLFNSLVHTRVPTRELARKIIDESRIACKNHNSAKLRSEKSNLIRDVNYKIDKENVYDQKLSEYRVFSTVQALLNEWRGAQKLSPAEVVAYEAGLENWLIREAGPPTLSKTKDANPLVLQLMIEKFNKKYKNELDENQIKLLESCLNKDDRKTISQIKEIKIRAKKALTLFYTRCDNKFLNEKKDLITKKIDMLKPTSEEDSVTKALTLSRLVSEMESEDE